MRDLGGQGSEACRGVNGIWYLTRGTCQLTRQASKKKSRLLVKPLYAPGRGQPNRLRVDASQKVAAPVSFFPINQTAPATPPFPHLLQISTSTLHPPQFAV